MNKTFILLLIFILSVIPKTAHAESITLITTPNSGNQEIASVSDEYLEQLLLVTPPTLESVTIGTSRNQEKLNEASRNANPANVKQVALQMVTAKFGQNDFKAFDAIISRESNWNVNAVNKSSGACGLGQALPCSKLKDHSPKGQVEWVVKYIASRYGTPSNAWHFWQAHGWY